jgi:hypothetical protein
MRGCICNKVLSSAHLRVEYGAARAALQEPGQQPEPVFPRQRAAAVAGRI